MRIGLPTVTLVLAPSVCLAAASQPVEITAQKVWGNANTQVRATGKVTVKFKDVTITGDNALYDREKGILRVWGNVTVTEPPARLKCSNIVYNLKTKKAVLEKVEGWLSSTDRIKAQRVERLNEKEWIAYDGEYTPCSHSCPDWSVTAKEFKVLLGESFQGKWVAFRVKEVPILVSPYLSGPLKRKRSSGLLFPRFGYVNKDGFIYKQPLYIVLGRSADLTVTLEKRTRNGKGLEANFRYVLGKENRGELDYYQIVKKERKDWKLNFSHYYFPSDYLYGSAKASVVSSRNYYTSSTSFNVEEETQLYSKSDVTGSKLWEHAILNVNAVYLRYLNGAADTIYQKLPNVNFYLMDTPIPKTPFTFNLDSEVTYFYRKAGGSSYRLNATPAVRYSRNFGVVKESALLSYLFTSYQHGGSRHLWKFTNSLRTNRFYPLGNYALSVNPELLFTYVESKDQNNLPLFDTTDRIPGEKSLSVSVTNYLYGPKGRVARGSLSTTFNMYSQSWQSVKGDLELSPLKWLSLRETVQFSPQEGRVEFSNTYTSVSLFGVNLWSNYYYQSIPEGLRYLRWGTSVPLGRYLTFSYSQRYDLKLSQDREKEYALTVNRGCWSGVLSYRWLKTYDNTIKYQIMLRINLVKLGSYGYKLSGERNP